MIVADPGVPLDPDRRSRLYGVKLAALARDHLGIEDGDAAPFPGGAALRMDRTGVVLVEEDSGRGVGRALAWGRRHDVDVLHVLVTADAGVLARRAGAFAVAPSVWWVDGRELHRAEPDPFVAAPPAMADAGLVAQLTAAGAAVVTEHGATVGEVFGLEVARIIGDGPAARIEVGVGPHDREAFALVHGHRPTAAALADVIGSVRHHRAVAVADHPLRRLAPERWLRDVIVARPDLAGAATLARHQGPAPRPDLKDPWPAVAAGTGADGAPVVVVCSVGVDLDLVPFAADARLAVDPTARLVLVVPERDALPIVVELAASLTAPADLRTVPTNWRALG